MTSRLSACLAGRRPGRPLLVAHRGASAEAPENTLAAIGRAWDYGVDGVEVDIHLSADGECVVIHDPTTARTTNAGKKVSECTAEELRRLDAGSWKGAEFAGQRIPLIEEVLERIPPGKFQCIELKEGQGLEEALHERLNALGREDSVCVLAFDPERIGRFKKLLPEVPAFLLLAPEIDLANKAIRPFSEKAIEWVKACGADAPACFEGAVTKTFVEQVHAAGMPLLVWVVNDLVRARQLADWGVDAIATDAPGFIKYLSPAIFLDIQGFSSYYLNEEKDTHAKAMMILRNLADDIERIGENSRRLVGTRLFGNQVGDGFIISPQLDGPSLVKVLPLAIALMRSTAIRGGYLKAAVSYGEMADIQGVFSERIRRKSGGSGVVRIGDGLMTIFPVMGDALARSHCLSKRASGPILLVEKEFAALIRRLNVPFREYSKHLEVDWIRADLPLAEQMLKAIDDLPLVDKNQLIRGLQNYINAAARLPDHWKKGAEILIREPSG